MAEKIVMTAEDMRRTLARIAHEIIERNKGTGELILIGLRTRGYPLAKRLADSIQQYEGAKLNVGALDFSRYRDDLNGNGVPKVPRTEIPYDINGKSVLLVDDVIHTGRSIRAAMDAERHTARGAHRPRPPRNAHPRGLRGQEHPQRAP